MQSSCNFMIGNFLLKNHTQEIRHELMEKFFLEVFLGAAESGKTTLLEQVRWVDNIFCIILKILWNNSQFTKNAPSLCDELSAIDSNYSAYDFAGFQLCEISLVTQNKD